MSARPSLVSRVFKDFEDFAKSETHAGLQLGAVKCAEQILALAEAGEWGRSFTQALAELREWYKSADETRGGKQGPRDSLAELLASIPDSPADLA